MAISATIFQTSIAYWLWWSTISVKEFVETFKISRPRIQLDGSRPSNSSSRTTIGELSCPARQVEQPQLAHPLHQTPW